MTEPQIAEAALNVLALRLLQLEPDEREEVGRARDQLATLARAGRLVPAVRSPVGRAVAALTSLADGTVDDPAAAMRAAGLALQQAVGVSPPRGPARRLSHER